MLVGLIADTHGLLRPEVTDVFVDVDLILHAGDVGKQDVLDGLERIAPVTAVRGNADGMLGSLPEIAHIDLGGVRVVVVHGDQLGSPTPEKVGAAYPDADVVVFGHSHRPVVRRVGSVLAVNPGSAGRGRFRDPVSVALLAVDGGRANVRLVSL